MDNAGLRYWGEPETVYYTCKVVYWSDDPDNLKTNRPSLGYMPVYETEKQAQDEHPNCEVFKVELKDVPTQ